MILLSFGLSELDLADGALGKGEASHLLSEALCVEIALTSDRWIGRGDQRGHQQCAFIAGAGSAAFLAFFIYDT